MSFRGRISTEMGSVSDWTRTFVRRDSSLRDVLETIDAAELQIALVVDDKSRLEGVITDGDVRRALLGGITLEAPAESLMTRTPVTASPDMKQAAIERLMYNHELHQVPIVDADGMLVGLALHGKLLPRERLDNEVYLMVGGLGSRLGSLTKRTPKPLLRVGDRPILEIILDSLISQGFYRFNLVVNYKAELIERYFGNGHRWGAEISYLRERKRMGTCGGLRIAERLPDKPFLVLNGDILTKVQFKALLDYHLSHDGVATMAVREYSVQIPFGVAQINDHRVSGLTEKPTERYLVNGGIYVLDPSCLELIPQDEYLDMTTLLGRLIESERGVYSWPIEDYWLDIGRVADFQQAHDDFEEYWYSDDDPDEAPQ